MGKPLETRLPPGESPPADPGPKTPPGSDPEDDVEMTFFEHLAELRGRFIRALIGLVPGIAIAAIYAEDIRNLRALVDVKALAHITGGGIEGNAPRVIPDGCGMVIDPTAWPRPAVVQWLADQGVEEAELRRVFNIGIGMIAVVDPSEELAAIGALKTAGRDAWVIGAIETGEGVRYSA